MSITLRPPAGRVLRPGDPGWGDARLTRIKAAVDPGNLFRSGHQIPPAVPDRRLPREINLDSPLV